MVHVTCAVIEKIINNEPCFLVCQRSENMRLPLKWEFPGGKVEANESLQACLQREIREELGLLIKVGQPLKPVTFSYTSGRIILLPFFCQLISEKISLTEHKAYKWQPKTLLTKLDWAAADMPIVQQLLQS